MIRPRGAFENHFANFLLANHPMKRSPSGGFGGACRRIPTIADCESGIFSVR